MKVLVVNSNLNKPSRTGALAEIIKDEIENYGHEVYYLDLKSEDMPFCDGKSCYEDERVLSLTTLVNDADAAVLVSPVYNYMINAAMKNFIELTDKAWTGKIIAFACTAGGAFSYMSGMSFMNAMMLDYRCIVIPRNVYILSSQFLPDGGLVEECEKRVQDLAQTVDRMMSGLGAKDAVI